ncbi:hypothetical protein Tco_1452080 [Tanacetum coccineum]
MNPIATQQVALDDALVALEKRLKIENLFLITAEVPEVYMHQFWNTIKKIKDIDAYRCISGKSSGLDRLRLSRAQILWGMYNKKNVDFVALLWEDFFPKPNNRE